MPRAVQNLLHAHFEDHIGMRADAGPKRGHITQHWVEYCPGLPVVDRIHPNEHSVNSQKLPAHLVGDTVGIDRGLDELRRCLCMLENTGSDLKTMMKDENIYEHELG
jgi:hypothetical protein